MIRPCFTSERCRAEGTPRLKAGVRAHAAVFWAFANAWRDVFKNGVADHSIKELCRIYVSRSVKCEYCGNQRSMKAAKQGIVEDDYMDLINFEKSTRYNEKQKAALAYAEAITWDLPADDAFWTRLHKHFSEPELVEIGNFVAITMGQQRWLRTINIEHHQILRARRHRWRRVLRTKAPGAPSKPRIIGHGPIQRFTQPNDRRMSGARRIRHFNAQANKAAPNPRAGARQALRDA